MTLERVADDWQRIKDLFPSSVRDKFVIHSYRSAASILFMNFPEQFDQIIKALEAFEIDERMIRTAGGSKGPIAKYVDTLFTKPDWQETHITADLHVRLLPAKGKEVIREYVRTGYLDGHRIDFVNGKIALDFEWNSKDQTFDRDLYAFSAFHAAGAIDVGILLTRGSSLDMDFMKGLGKALDKGGDETTSLVHAKFGASTTFMGKLIPRLEAGRNGGCPVLALGITPKCVKGPQ